MKAGDMMVKVERFEAARLLAEDGGGAIGLESKQPLEAEKGQETDSLLPPQEETWLC